jgi:hypothetical protein
MRKTRLRMARILRARRNKCLSLWGLVMVRWDSRRRRTAENFRVRAFLFVKRCIKMGTAAAAKPKRNKGLRNERLIDHDSEMA